MEVKDVSFLNQFEYQFEKPKRKNKTNFQIVERKFG